MLFFSVLHRISLPTEVEWFLFFHTCLTHHTHRFFLSLAPLHPFRILFMPLWFQFHSLELCFCALRIRTLSLPQIFGFCAQWVFTLLDFYYYTILLFGWLLQNCNAKLGWFGCYRRRRSVYCICRITKSLLSLLCRASLISFHSMPFSDCFLLALRLLWLWILFRIYKMILFRMITILLFTFFVALPLFRHTTTTITTVTARAATKEMKQNGASFTSYQDIRSDLFFI